MEFYAKARAHVRAEALRRQRRPLQALREVQHGAELLAVLRALRQPKPARRALRGAVLREDLRGGTLGATTRVLAARIIFKGDFHYIYSHLRVIFTLYLVIKCVFHSIHCHLGVIFTRYLVTSG